MPWVPAPGVSTLSLCHEEAGAGTAVSDAERHCRQASRARSAVRGAVAISVDTRVDAAAVEVDTDPRSISEGRRVHAPITAYLQALDVKMVRRLAHDASYRPRSTDEPSTKWLAVADFSLFARGCDGRGLRWLAHTGVRPRPRMIRPNAARLIIAIVTVKGSGVAAPPAAAPKRD